MIRITEESQFGTNLQSFAYVQKRLLVGKIVVPITRYLRARNAERYMKPAQRHLDVGCGDGYFLRRSRCRERFGIDKLLGDEVSDKLNFPDSYFDYVTMLAVIEHISFPEEILREASRILKRGGRLIITTPRKAAEFLIRIYARNVDEDHKSYFDYDRMQILAGRTFEIVGYHTFMFGFNQVFCLEKIKPPV